MVVEYNKESSSNVVTSLLLPVISKTIPNELSCSVNLKYLEIKSKPKLQTSHIVKWLKLSVNNILKHDLHTTKNTVSTA